MTHSSTTQTPDHQTVELSTGRLRSWLVFIFRLLLLGVSSGFALMLGIAIAQFFPAQTQDPPFLERAFRQTDAWIDTLRRLPQPWQQDATPSVPPATTAPGDSDSASPSVQLNDTEQQRLQSELTRLESDLSALGDRAAALERRMGVQNSAESVEARIQTLEQQLNAEASGTGTNPATNPETTAVPAVNALTAALTADRSETLMVTLPSDALFTSGETVLRSGSQEILDSIISDLQGYPGATIRIGAHTDAQAQPGAGDRVRSFEQAKLVEQYLAAKLGDSYHWVVIGYGGSQPLVENDTPANRQRNRRVEIAIEP
jgi:outer membrane protein OmpA-like peptidoglycan-associated protein